MLNFQPTTKDEAMRTVVMMTDMVEMSIRDLPHATPRKQDVMIARFKELNEVRVRIIEQWGLQDFAAQLS